MSRNKDMFEKPEIIGLFEAKCKEAGHDVLITCIDRSYKEQTAYFAQGREDLVTVNRLRFVAGLLPITALENLHCVTWTMNSEHIVNLDDQRKDNDKSRAFDFAILVEDGRNISWDIKADVDKDKVSDYAECALIGESLGLFSGARFKTRDWPHLQIKPISGVFPAN